MNKRFTKAMVAGSVLASTIGNAGLAMAYSGETNYPENRAMGLVATVIDVRHNEITAHLREISSDSAILKGLMFFEGDVEDAELLTAYPGDEYELTQYYRFDFESEEWEDKATGEEMTVEMAEDLGENTSRKLGFTYYFWVDDILRQMNIRWGRIDYGRCANSTVFLENEEAICRAEVWDDGEIHYQPYVGWERLSLEDGSDEEAGTIKVYKDTEWVAEGDEDGEGNDDNGGDEAGEGGDTETPSESESGESDGGDSVGDGESGGDSGDVAENVEVRYVEKEVLKEVIKEVPVEKIKTVEVEKPVEKVKTVEVEVPVEKFKTVEVQVPVEKKVVEIKEVVKEVPMFGTTLAQATGLDELVAAESQDEDDDDSEEVEDNESDEELEEEYEDEIAPETMDIPELGKDVPTDTNVVGKVATFVAGVVSAAALLMIGIAFRKRKQSN